MILNEYKQHLEEGVNDPAIFKVVFLAGGPGSGKSFIVGKTALSALGYTTINSDHPFEVLMKKLNLDFKMPESEKEVRDKARLRAKATAKAKLDLALDGRLGMVIDGTGQDFAKIQQLRIKLAALGYDAAMIFVNTNVDTALSRNAQRARSVPSDIAKGIWQGVQDNIGKFKQFFGDRFHIIDNSEGVDYQEQVNHTYKQIMKWTKEPPKNALAKRWIAQQRGVKESIEEIDEAYIVSYSKSKDGPIHRVQTDDRKAAENYLEKMKQQGYKGIISIDGRVKSKMNEDLDEASQNGSYSIYKVDSKNNHKHVNVHTTLKSALKAVKPMQDGDKKNKYVVHDTSSGKYSRFYDASGDMIDHDAPHHIDVFKGKPQFESIETIFEQTYFATMADAVQFARMSAEKKGYEIDADDWFEKVNTGPKKPSKGKTNSYNIKLKKDGKETKRGLAIQVYGMDSGKFELNSYIS